MQLNQKHCLPFLELLQGGFPKDLVLTTVCSKDFPQQSYTWYLCIFLHYIIKAIIYFFCALNVKTLLLL